MKNEIIISEYGEILALHKTLMEAKFHPDPQNTYIAASPHVANICNRVIEVLIEIESKNDPGKRDNWNKWLDLKNQKWIWERAIEYANDSSEWETLNDEEKKDYVRCLLSPFRFNEDDVLRFIKEVDGF